jgi:dienelactone hydrolase
VAVDRRRRRRRIWLAVLLGPPLALVLVAAILFGPFLWGLTRVKPEPGAAFQWPYYLYLPRSLPSAGGGPLYLLVSPNNTGRPDDRFAVHARAALARTFGARGLAEDLGTPLLVPVFPRPARQAQIYTHALDRDALLTDDPKLARLDLQLLAMADHAARRLRAAGYQVDDRLLLMGFSANGMFTNRMSVLHPRRVLAAAAGSPGGWPLAPLATWEGRPLRYPVGVADLRALTGADFDAEAFRQVAELIYMGDADRNDSVAKNDGYDPPDRELVYQLFGKDMVGRLQQSERLYRSVHPEVVFRLYPGAGHRRTTVMDADVRAFFKDVLARTRAASPAR